MSRKKPDYYIDAREGQILDFYKRVGEVPKIDLADTLDDHPPGPDARTAEEKIVTKCKRQLTILCRDHGRNVADLEDGDRILLDQGEGGTTEYIVDGNTAKYVD